MLEGVDKRELDLQIQHRLIDRLSVSESRYRSLVENIYEIVFQTDEKFNFCFINKAWSSITGIPIEEAVGKPVGSFVHPTFKTVWQSFICDLNADCLQATTLDELCLVRADGSRCWVTFVMQRQRNEGGWIGSMHDITSNRDAEQLRRQHRQLDIIQKAQGTFIANSDPYHLFGSFLPDILDLTNSKFGFIGEILSDENGQELTIYAVNNIEWGEDIRSMYAAKIVQRS